MEQTYNMALFGSGRIVIRSSTSPEIYAFDQKRPVRAVALEPNFCKKSSKAVVAGGMAGMLIMYEKGWLGHKETVLHSGEGPIWAIEWQGNYIAWANDKVNVWWIHLFEKVDSSFCAFLSIARESKSGTLHRAHRLPLLIGQPVAPEQTCSSHHSTGKTTRHC